MEPLPLLAQFLAVFAAAFLAFGLENLRERRRTSRWVREHLRHLSDLMQPESGQLERAGDLLAEQLQAIDAWLAAERPDELTDRQWELIDSSMRTIGGNEFGPLLRSEAVTVLPRRLASALARLEVGAQMLGAYSESVQEAHREILPAWCERRAPLDPADARRLGRFRTALVAAAEESQRLRPVLEEVAAGLERWSSHLPSR